MKFLSFAMMCCLVFACKRRQDSAETKTIIKNSSKTTSMIDVEYGTAPLAFDPQDKSLALGRASGTTSIVELGNLSTIKSLAPADKDTRGNALCNMSTCGITKTQFDPSGKFLAIGHENTNITGWVEVWNTENWQRIAVLESFTHFDFSNTNALLTHNSRIVELFDPVQNKVLGDWRSDNELRSAKVIDSNARSFLALTDDHGVVVNTSTAKVLRTIPNLKSAWADSFVINGDQIFYPNGDSNTKWDEIAVWNLNSGARTQSAPGHSKSIGVVHWDQHSNQLVTMSDNEIIAWDSKSMKQTFKEGRSGNYFHKAEFLDASHLLFGTPNKISIVDTTTKAVRDVYLPKDYFSIASGIAVSSDGKVVALTELHTGLQKSRVVIIRP